MATVYLVTNTANTKTITIQPGTVNGPAGTFSDTDINLHGVGALQWGSKLDENFVRLTENFACPEKPGQPGVPADANDLGPGYGINNPVAGQLWFNTDTATLMLYDGTDWKQAGGSSTIQPLNPKEGDLWYDTSINQLMVYNGTAWESVAERYVLASGNTPMTGSLDLNSNTIINVADPVNPQDAATKSYVDTQVSAVSGSLSNYLPLTGGTMQGAVYFDNASVFIRDVGGTVLELNAFGGGVSMNTAGGSLQHSGTDVLTWSSSLITLGGVRITNLANGTGPTDAVTKQQLDAVSGSIPSGTIPEIYTSLVSTNKAGDIAISGGKIYIALAANNWKQVWPAVYS